MPLGRITDVGNHIARDEHINRCTDGVKASKDVQRVMLETGKWPSREQEVDRDALGQRSTGGHFRDASGTATPQAEAAVHVVMS
jgi:hypothetical protein